MVRVEFMLCVMFDILNQSNAKRTAARREREKKMVQCRRNRQEKIR